MLLSKSRFSVALSEANLKFRLPAFQSARHYTGPKLMRYILIFSGLPMGFFWGWYFLSYNDINFGLLFFSRVLHDFAFGFYGELLGVDPSAIGPMVARACAVDTLLIFSIFGFRRRREILEWWRARVRPAVSEPGRVPPAE